jgi:hypothetical protein
VRAALSYLGGGEKGSASPLELRLVAIACPLPIQSVASELHYADGRKPRSSYFELALNSQPNAINLSVDSL